MSDPGRSDLPEILGKLNLDFGNVIGFYVNSCMLCVNCCLGLESVYARETATDTLRVPMAYRVCHCPRSRVRGLPSLRSGCHCLWTRNDAARFAARRLWWVGSERSGEPVARPSAWRLGTRSCRGLIAPPLLSPPHRSFC